jgi:hypothetical protein
MDQEASSPKSSCCGWDVAEGRDSLASCTTLNGARTSFKNDAVLHLIEMEAMRWLHHHPLPQPHQRGPYSLPACRNSTRASSSIRCC